MLESLVFSHAKIFSLVSLLFLASNARAISTHLFEFNILVIITNKKFIEKIFYYILWFIIYIYSSKTVKYFTIH